MATCVVMLGIHRGVQEKVLAELRSTFQNKNEEVDAASLQKLVYLEMVIKEAMRLFPIAPTIGRKVTSDLQLDGEVIFNKFLYFFKNIFTDEITLPKGANVFIRTIDIQRNPRYWGEFYLKVFKY
jgi:hypothetical protein